MVLLHQHLSAEDLWPFFLQWMVMEILVKSALGSKSTLIRISAQGEVLGYSLLQSQNAQRVSLRTATWLTLASTFPVLVRMFWHLPGQATIQTIGISGTIRECLIVLTHCTITRRRKYQISQPAALVARTRTQCWLVMTSQQSTRGLHHHNCRLSFCISHK